MMIGEEGTEKVETDKKDKEKTKKKNTDAIHSNF